MQEKNVLFSFHDNEYDMEKFSCDKMALLGVFFSTDYYLCRYDGLLEWANDPEQNVATANLMYLEKKDGIVSIGDLYGKEPFETFDLSLEAFIKLLNDWERVTKQKPKEIVITQEGDTITVQGKN